MNNKLIIVAGLVAGICAGIVAMPYLGGDLLNVTAKAAPEEFVIVDEEQKAFLELIGQCEQFLDEYSDKVESFLDDQYPEETRVCAAHTIKDIADVEKDVSEIKENVRTQWAQWNADTRESRRAAFQSRVLPIGMRAGSWEKSGSGGRELCQTCSAP